MIDFAMTEHPAWLPAEDGWRRVLVMPDGGNFLATVTGGRLATRPLDTAENEPAPDLFAVPDGSPVAVPELAGELAGLGTVGRYRNPDLWDAIGTAIVRQVIRAAQSKKLYRALCAAHGRRVELPGGDCYPLFPTPDTVLRLSKEQFQALGLAFKRRPLLAAAEAFLDRGTVWQTLAPVELINALQTVARIGPWTARAAVADWSNDWSLYPYSDLAVRTWALRAAPSYVWPTEEPAFGQLWWSLAGKDLSSLTLLTLAWGSRHGDIG